MSNKQELLQSLAAHMDSVSEGSDGGKATLQTAAVRRYYSTQQEILDSWQQQLAQSKTGGLHGEIPLDELPDLHGAGKCRRFFLSPVYLALLFNVLLLVAKAAAVSTSSGSLAVISSMLDSALDIFASFALWLAARGSSNVEPVLFPVGKNRYEPVAIIIIAAVMTTAALQVIIRSIEMWTGTDGRGFFAYYSARFAVTARIDP